MLSCLLVLCSQASSLAWISAKSGATLMLELSRRKNFMEIDLRVWQYREIAVKIAAA
jgi:hypothetical protein